MANAQFDYATDMIDRVRMIKQGKFRLVRAHAQKRTHLISVYSAPNRTARYEHRAICGCRSLAQSQVTVKRHDTVK